MRPIKSHVLIALSIVATLGVIACTELGDDASSDPRALATPVPVDEWIQPSCVPPMSDDDGTHADGEDCDGTATDDFCDIVPMPGYYCVTCTLSGSACYPDEE